MLRRSVQCISYIVHVASFCTVYHTKKEKGLNENYA